MSSAVCYEKSNLPRSRMFCSCGRHQSPHSGRRSIRECLIVDIKINILADKAACLGTIYNYECEVHEEIIRLRKPRLKIATRPTYSLKKVDSFSALESHFTKTSLSSWPCSWRNSRQLFRIGGTSHFPDSDPAKKVRATPRAEMN